MVDVDDFLNLLSHSFGLPILKCEINLILTKYQRRGRINIETFLDNIENITGKDLKTNIVKQTSNLEGEAFGKTLFKKLCKLRANENSRVEFRKILMMEDIELVGYISKNNLQKVLDKQLDLSDAEGSLLIENLCFTDGSHRNDVDYSLLLLLLNEPLKRNVQTISAGTAMMNKMMRGSDSVALRRLLTLLFKNFAASDPRALGVIPYVSAEKLLKEECHNVDSRHLTQVLETFQDYRSDCIFYPEMLSFLGNCSVWNVMHRIRYIDQIRQKQGYNFSEYLKNYAAKKGQKIDFTRLSEQLLAIGILLPETGLTTIFGQYSGNNKNSNGNSTGYSAGLSSGIGMNLGLGGGNLDVGVFAQAIADVDGDDNIGNKSVRNEIKPYEGKQINFTFFSLFSGLNFVFLFCFCHVLTFSFIS